MGSGSSGGGVFRWVRRPVTTRMRKFATRMRMQVCTGPAVSVTSDSFQKNRSLVRPREMRRWPFPRGWPGPPRRTRNPCARPVAPMPAAVSSLRRAASPPPALLRTRGTTSRLSVSCPQNGQSDRNGGPHPPHAPTITHTTSYVKRFSLWGVRASASKRGLCAHWGELDSRTDPADQPLSGN